MTAQKALKDNSYQNVFRRCEKKYLLTRAQFKWITEYLSDITVPDKYSHSTVCNIYFDTPAFRLIRASIEKPIYKEKLRLRTYGIPKSDSSAFVELKKKYKGIVYKRRECMDYLSAESYLYDGISPEYNTQIIKEIDWFKHYYGKIAPAMFISYDRAAVYAKENSNLRITFDTNITYRNYDLDLQKGIYGNNLIDDKILMEIKIPDSLPLWLSNELTLLRIYPVSFSKYGSAYSEYLKSQKIGGIYCG